MNISEIKQYVFEYANSNMYVIAKNGSALVIDPNISESALKYLHNNNVLEITVLLTHEHYDHTSGLIWLCEKFKSTVICHEETALSLSNGKNNRPIIIASTRQDSINTDDLKKFIRSLPQGYLYNADITFSKQYDFVWNNHQIRIVGCPGHSKGSCCIEIDKNIVATGDSLILHTPVITRFPGGSAEQYNAITMPYLKSIKNSALILPGHGDEFYLNEVSF